MKYFSSPRWLTAACVAIVLTNLALLLAAGANRRGTPQVELTLSEREFALPAVRQDEGRILTLSIRMTHQPPGVLRRLAARRHYELPAVEFDWLDRAKLRELGFAVELDPDDAEAAEQYGRSTPRRVYLVLEHDGETWRRWIESREEQVEKVRREVAAGLREPVALADAEAVLAMDRTMRSRLFPVDAGMDADALGRRYGEGSFLILAGLVRPRIVSNSEEEPGPVLTGDIMGLVADGVHVPGSLRPPLEDFLSDETWRELEARERREAERGWLPPTSPRYRAVLALGQRYEPWLVRTECIPSRPQSTPS